VASEHGFNHLALAFAEVFKTEMISERDERVFKGLCRLCHEQEPSECEQ
jgi:hypothetical protein